MSKAKLTNIQQTIFAISDLLVFSNKSGIEMNRLLELKQGADPTLAEIRHLSDTLKIPIASLVIEDKAKENSKILFRSAGAQVNENAISQLHSKLSASKFFADHEAQLQALTWKSKFINTNNNIANAYKNAKVFRTLFFNDDQLGPLHSLPKLAANKLNIILFVTKSPDFDGASAIIEGSAYAFISARFRPRMLFTLAHEIGHLIAHHNIDQPFAIVDHDIEHGLTSKAEEERYANAFASELLMPKKGLAVTLKTIRQFTKTNTEQIGDVEINLLARIYGVSFWAAALRCETLQLIPKGGAFSLQEHLTKNHGSPEKRAEELGLPPRSELHFPPVPSALLQSAVSSINRGIMSIGKAAALLEVSITDLMTENVTTTH